MSTKTFTIADNEILLKQSFSKEFSELINSIPQEILKIEALDRDSLDIAKRFAQYHSSSVPLTGEENANVGKSIHPSHRHEKVYEGLGKLKSYSMIHEAMVKTFGLDRANEAIHSMLYGSIAMNDSGNADLPYCVAYSSSHLMKDGRQYIQDVPNVPPTNFRSYINMVSESMFDACAEFMGK